MSRPNILFVFADQLRYSALGCSGNRVVRTPAFDRLAREGVVFDQAFSSCPICSPYRAQVITGRYSHANGVVCNQYRLFDGQRTIAHALGDAGYRTAYVGKWHLGQGPYTPDKRYGFDNMYAFNSRCNAYDEHYWDNEEGPFPIVGFGPRTETQLTLDFIDNHRNTAPDQPFCVLMSWIPPHWSDTLSERDYGAYPQEFSEYRPEEVDVPDNVPKQMRDFARREIADYYGMVTALDACMARILATLDRWGLADNTIVCFSSDHGDHLSSYGYGKPSDLWLPHTLQLSKGTPHEESVHIPFIMRYPERIKGNCRTETLFNSVDVFPTLAGLCGVDVPDEVQGKDLSHAALGEPGEEPDSVYLQILGPGWPPRTKTVGLWRGIRDHRYTYARWKDCGGKRVLYDRENDPLEMSNLADEPEYANVVVEMEARLQRWIEETGDPFDTGKRLPVTGMLDLGQVFINERSFEGAPEEYADAIRPNLSDFTPW